MESAWNAADACDFYDHLQKQQRRISCHLEQGAYPRGNSGARVGEVERPAGSMAGTHEALWSGVAMLTSTGWESAAFQNTLVKAL